MLQREVAAEIGVDKTTVFNWEAGTVRPAGRYMTAIVRFLGYSPEPTAMTAEVARTAGGWSC
jgi:DNA-binding XRE family transcriptional regulator